MNVCPKCGTPISPEYKFCAKCGLPLQAQPIPVRVDATPAEPITPTNINEATAPITPTDVPEDTTPITPTDVYEEATSDTPPHVYATANPNIKFQDVNETQTPPVQTPPPYTTFDGTMPQNP